MYSPAVGVVYIFNLIVGTGALTLPKAMASAGWLVSLILLTLLGFVSYITTTFMVESLSIANACIRRNKRENLSEDSVAASDTDSDSNRSINPPPPIDPTERSALLDSASSSYTSRRSSINSNTTSMFSITRAVEMGQMADMFFNKIGRILFYVCIIVYLYGDLAIYAAAVPKSMRDIVCGNMSCSTNDSNPPQDGDICWGTTITRNNVYQIFLALFTIVLGPFTYFSVQKTKYLQIFTTVLRWLAFLSMITLAIIHISTTRGGEGHPPVANISGVPNLFGVSVYSFMCQHSLPSLVTPIRNKRRLPYLLGADYILILLFYMLLGMTAIYCFQSDVIKDIYTLNFQDSCDVTNIIVLRYFLGLFPVFTLSSNFPIIAVTLRNNLKALFKPSSSFWVNRILFPTIAIVPPIIVAFITNNLTTLVGITGSYAGAGVQYVIPACLVLLARQEATQYHGSAVVRKNRHRSPFSRRLWVIMVLAWAAVCLVFVTVNHILSLP
uniref:transmembrane protein 104 isoform X3 n=1 Tax=Ciona intestinalis TaxID=7719 RepID=UPI0002B8E677|nr:transmembrane protein 104 isoform X3 [Ciona intestinalis]|eukprot:XP_004226232.1 transmembrane protein 104 isoform X3 [Ciona intestinalis]